MSIPIKISMLKEYDQLYYNEGSSPIVDEEYDRLKEEAQLLYPEHPYFDSVGAPVDEASLGSKVKLPYTLGSLKKVKPDTSTEAWIRKEADDICVSAKVDGVSIYVAYKNGSVIRAYTRGNGEVGKDITAKAKVFCPRVPSSDFIELRGEATLMGDDFEKLGFKTKRNGTAGILNREDVSPLDRKVQVVFYELISGPVAIQTEFQRFKFLNFLKLNTPQYQLVSNEVTEADLARYLADTKQSSEYDIDGLVLTRNRSEREDTYYPDDKVAFKMPGEAKLAVVNHIEWSVTRTGRVMPVVVIEPIELDGVTVGRATGFNAEYIKEKNLQTGAKVRITRSGDVIPHIIEVVHSPGRVSMIDKCPSCQKRIQWVGVDLICSNKFCSEKMYYTVEYFLRKLGAENITALTLKKLNVDSIERLYELSPDMVLGIDGFGEKRAIQIIAEIQSTWKTTPDKVLKGFGMSGLGIEGIRSILKEYSFDDVWDVTVDQLTEIDGIGDTLANNFVNEIGDVKEVWDKISHNFEFEVIDNKLNGKLFCLSGKSPLKRNFLISEIEKVGGVVKGISKKIDYMVTDDVDTQTSKVKRAQKYGINIIDYGQLFEMVGIDENI